MRNDYLLATKTAVFDANGNATVVLRPDVTQWWYPTFVRVATVNQSPPPPFCTVYLGAPVGTVAQTMFVDSTFLGNNDTSSIIGGVVAQYGEAITAVWSSGTPGDTALFSVYGMVSDVPTAIGTLLPGHPGTHFVGYTTNRFYQVVSTAAYNGFTTLGPFFVGSAQSIGLTITTGTGTGTLRFTWYNDRAGLFSSTGDDIQFQANTKFIQSVVVKGPYFKVFVIPSTTPWNISGIIMYALPVGVIPQLDAQANIIFSNPAVAVGAASSTNIISTVILVTEAVWQITSALATYNAHIDSIAADGTLQQLDFTTQADARMPRSVFLPATPIQATLSNPTGGAGTIGIRMTAKPGMSGI